MSQSWPLLLSFVQSVLSVVEASHTLGFRYLFIFIVATTDDIVSCLFQWVSVETDFGWASLSHQIYYLGTRCRAVCQVLLGLIPAVCWSLPGLATLVLVQFGVGLWIKQICRGLKIFSIGGIAQQRLNIVLMFSSQACKFLLTQNVSKLIWPCYLIIFSRDC